MQNNDLQQDINNNSENNANEIKSSTNSDETTTPEKVAETNLNASEEKISKLTAELAELQEKYLRLYSEFENFRRRTNKEKIELIDFAAEKTILELLPVIDDFDRATQVMKDTSDFQSACDGIHLIFSKMKKILIEKGLEEMDCIGKEFDPELHDAITKIPAPNKKLKGKIVDQINKGYTLKGKVIRHSKVVVGE